MNLYFCGSMTSSQEKMGDYKELIDSMENYGNVLNKFVGEKIVNDEPLDIYKRDTGNLRKAEKLVADVSVVSTGVGFELGYADLLNIPTLIIYDDNMPLPSALIIGNDKFQIKSYHNLDEAKDIIKEFLTLN